MQGLDEALLEAAFGLNFTFPVLVSVCFRVKYFNFIIELQMSILRAMVRCYTLQTVGEKHLRNLCVFVNLSIIWKYC